MILDHAAISADPIAMDDQLAADASDEPADEPAAPRRGRKKKKAAAGKKKRAGRGRRAGSAANGDAPANGRRKNKKTKKGASGNGRRSRGPSRKTVEKQNYIREMLQLNPQQSINQSIEAVKARFGTTIQFERAREIHEEYGPIRRGRRGGAAAPGIGIGRPIGGRGRRAAAAHEGGGYLVAVNAGRGRVDARVFNTPAEVTDYVNRLTQRDGVALQDINFYQRFEPEISVRI